MNIINYSITIELTMTRTLRFPVGCDMKRAENYFYEHRCTTEDNKEKKCYNKAIIVLRHAKNYGGLLTYISSESINKKHICRFSFAFSQLEGLQKFTTAVSC